MRYTQPLSSILHVKVPLTPTGIILTCIYIFAADTEAVVDLIDALVNPSEYSTSQNSTAAVFSLTPRLEVNGNVCACIDVV